VILAAVLLSATLPGWMSGSWAGTVRGVEMEEHWTTAKGGVMAGMHRDVKPNGKTSIEFARIQLQGDDVVFLAQPGGQPPTPFRMVESAEQRIVFENKEHDYPQRIVYWLGKDGALCAATEAADGADREEWCWTRRR
jgi:hypothetical protein